MYIGRERVMCVYFAFITEGLNEVRGEPAGQYCHSLKRAKENQVDASLTFN